MEQEEVIREQMNDTRTAMKDKLGSLEQKVVNTVQDATSAVTDTVASVKDTLQEATSAVSETVATVKDSIQDTVSSVTGSVQDTMTAVKDSMGEGVDAVKNLFDVRGRVERHPWPMLGGSLALGFILQRLLTPKKSERTRSEVESAPRNSGWSNAKGQFASSVEEAPAQEKSGWFEAFGPEIDKLKGLALGAIMGTAKEMVMQAVPPQMGDHLKEIIDNVTKKLGGEPVSKEEGDFGAPPPSSGSENDFAKSQPKQRSGNHRDPMAAGFQR